MARGRRESVPSGAATTGRVTMRSGDKIKAKAKVNLKSILKTASQPKSKLAKKATVATQMAAKPAKKAVVPERAPSPVGEPAAPREAVFVQIVTGSYDRVLHGIVVRIPKSVFDGNDDEEKEGGEEKAKFADNFLLGSHTAAIRAVAVSALAKDGDGDGDGGQSRRHQTVMLASGGNDERINVYQLTTSPPASTSFSTSAAVASAASTSRADGKTAIAKPKSLLPSLSGSSGILPPHPQNRELGSLMHHSGSVTALAFPTRAKLFSAGEDSRVAITRTRDMDLLATIKVPVPKPAGRPSGEGAGSEAALGGGINHFAVHPSLRLMITVSRADRAMRLWNLVTGKRDGTLAFPRAALGQVGAAGAAGAGSAAAAAADPIQIVWDPAGPDEFAVLFERGAIVFGIDCRPRCCVVAPAMAAGAAPGEDQQQQQQAAHALRRRAPKLHQLKYVPVPGDKAGRVLAVATEDGRIVFFSTGARARGESDGAAGGDGDGDGDGDGTVPLARPIGEFVAGPGRIKAFEPMLVRRPDGPSAADAADEDADALVLAYGCSSGLVGVAALPGAQARFERAVETAADAGAAGSPAGIAGWRRLMEYQTVNRITCMAAFEMTGDPMEDPEGSVDEGEESASGSGSESDSDSESD